MLVCTAPASEGSSLEELLPDEHPARTINKPKNNTRLRMATPCTTNKIEAGMYQKNVIPFKGMVTVLRSGPH